VKVTESATAGFSKAPLWRTSAADASAAGIWGGSGG
jgi:hypothetical protein